MSMLICGCDKKSAEYRDGYTQGVTEANAEISSNAPTIYASGTHPVPVPKDLKGDGCAQRAPAPIGGDELHSQWLEHVAHTKLGTKAVRSRSQRWQGVRITFTSSKASGMYREWLVLLPEDGRPRPKVLGNIYGALVVRPENKSGLAHPKCERLSSTVAKEILNWKNQGRYLSDDPWLANITPILFGESIETIRARWRLGQFMPEQLGVVQEHVYDLNVEAGEKDDYVPMEGTILLDADGIVLWHGVSSAETRSF
jgi:hypothetical protein